MGPQRRTRRRPRAQPRILAPTDDPRPVWSCSMTLNPYPRPNTCTRVPARHTTSDRFRAYTRERTRSLVLWSPAVKDRASIRLRQPEATPHRSVDDQLRGPPTSCDAMQSTITVPATHERAETRTPEPRIPPKQSPRHRQPSRPRDRIRGDNQPRHPARDTRVDVKPSLGRAPPASGACTLAARRSGGYRRPPKLVSLSHP
jgi:hypothetical protein